MAGGENLGARFSIDITDLKAGLTQANRLIRQSESEFQAAAAGMDDWTDSAEGLQKRVDSLSDQVGIQQEKVAALVKEKKRIIAQMEAEGKSNEDIERAIDGVNKQITKESNQLTKLKGSLSKSEKALQGFEESTDDVAESAEKAADSTDEMGDSFKGLKSLAAVGVGAIAGVAAAAGAAVGAFFGLAESTRETRTNIAKLETAFESAGLSAANAKDTYTELYSILGDEGTATEAAQHLAKIAEAGGETADMTHVLTGVFAEYGDSIPLEGLAEGISSTIAMSEVQGPLADALEWQGISLEDYNKKLAACSTEEERAALISQTLNELYSDSADIYKENNAAIMEAQEAQANLNSALAELGAIAEPIMTTLKNLVTDLLVSITPFVQMIGEGLSGALNGTAGSAQLLSDGLAGIFSTLVETATSMLPVVLEVLATLIPSLLTTLLAQIPSLLDFLLNTALPMVLNTLSQTLPQILIQISALIPQIIDTLILAIPTLLQAATTFLMAIVDALPSVIESLTLALPGLVQSICDTLATGIPILLDAAVLLLMAIVDALPQIIDSLVAALPQIIDTLVRFTTENIPVLLDAAVEFLMAIVEAIPDIVTALVKNLPQITTTILSALSDALPDLLATAGELFMQIVKAIPGICAELVKNIPEIITTIVSSLEDGFTSIKDVGLNLLKGLWDGIKSGYGWLKDKISGWADSVVGWAKDFLGIASPSKVFADEVGENMALGVGEGFTDGMRGVTRDMGRALDSATADVSINAGSGRTRLASGPNGGVNVYQTNNYSRAHSRYEIYKSKQDTAAAVRLALGGA